jgi:hypothetical protein
MANQGDNYIEENIIKEIIFYVINIYLKWNKRIRLLNFFRYFQSKRKIDLT